MSLKELERKIIEIEQDQKIESAKLIIKSINDLKTSIQIVTEEIEKL